MTHPTIKKVTWTEYCECPRCKEITLHNIKPDANLGQRVCDNCGHYETYTPVHLRNQAE